MVDRLHLGKVVKYYYIAALTTFFIIVDFLFERKLTVLFIRRGKI